MRKRHGPLFLILLAAAPLLAQSLPVPQGSTAAGSRAPLLAPNTVNSVLPATRAFVLQAFPESPTQVLLHWDIAPGYYLYRKSLALQDAQGRTIALALPQGEQFEDEYFGAVEIYRERLDVVVDVAAGADRRVELLLDYQGCAESLYCYPPQQLPLALTLP